MSTNQGSHPALEVREGDLLAEKYRIEQVLGAGGMGVVVAARHLLLDQKVAIKFLRPEMLADADAVARFQREARAAVRIKNEHIARVLDVGNLADGAPYIVMEFLEGCDLSVWLLRHGPLPIAQAIEFVLQACVAIADAHAAGIVHRDLKPANLFCVPRNDGQLIIKVLDFGISKLTETSAGGAGLSVTSTAAMMGSPLYMSPEQMRSSKDVDPSTDQWSLGIILFELLAGRTPFAGETFASVAVRVATEPPPPLRSFRSDVPEALQAVIQRCLAKDRANRYRHLGELAQALLAFAPARARAYAERIAGILQSAGMGTAPALEHAAERIATVQLPAPVAWGTIFAHGRHGQVHPFPANDCCDIGRWAAGGRDRRQHGDAMEPWFRKPREARRGIARPHDGRSATCPRSRRAQGEPGSSGQRHRRSDNCQRQSCRTCRRSGTRRLSICATRPSESAVRSVARGAPAPEWKRTDACSRFLVHQLDIRSDRPASAQLQPAVHH